MYDIAKRKFTELALDDSNYLTLTFNAKIHLTSSDLKLSRILNAALPKRQKR